jgi:acetyl-CoA carboxylase carboxyl transferase subunit alpha
MAASTLLKLGLIDEVIAEPLGGAHRDPDATAQQLKRTLLKNLTELNKIPLEKLLEQRYNKFMNMGRD